MRVYSLTAAFVLALLVSVFVWPKGAPSPRSDAPPVLVSSPDTTSSPWQWATQAGGSGRTYAMGLVVGSSGDVFVGGFLSGNAQFGDERVRLQGGANAYFARYRPDGTLRRVHTFGRSGHVFGSALALGPDSTLYLAGSVGPGILRPEPGRVSLGDLDIRTDTMHSWIAALRPDGTTQWATYLGGDGEVGVYSVGADDAGAVYVAGIFNGQFGTTDVRSRGGDDLFFAKYAPGGRLQWVKQIGGPNDEVSPSLAVRPDGRVAITGAFQDSISVMDRNVVAYSAGREMMVDGAGLKEPSNRTTELFLATLSAEGELLWMQTGRSTGHGSRPWDISFGPSGGVYVTGAFSKRLRLGIGTDTLSLKATEDGVYTVLDQFAAKYDSSGTAQWAWQGGGPSGSDIAEGIAVGPDGRSYVTGSYWEGATFGPVRFEPTNLQRHVVVVGLSPDGAVEWVERSTEHRGIDRSGTLTALDGSDLYVAGDFTGDMTLGPLRLEGLGGINMFLAKYRPDTTASF